MKKKAKSGFIKQIEKYLGDGWNVTSDKNDFVLIIWRKADPLGHKDACKIIKKLCKIFFLEYIADGHNFSTSISDFELHNRNVKKRLSTDTKEMFDVVKKYFKKWGNAYVNGDHKTYNMIGKIRSMYG